MRRICVHIFLFFLTSLLIFGCASSAKNAGRHIDYYTLEYPSPESSVTATEPAVLSVRPFQISPAYNTNKIVYRDKAFVRNTYHYHKWRANPADLVTDFLARDLRYSGLFKAVFITGQGQPSSHILEGTVEEFFEYDGEQSWQAVLSASVTLLKARESDISRRIISQNHYRVNKVCKAKNPQALAEAMSLAMAELSRMIRDDIAVIFGNTN